MKTFLEGRKTYISLAIALIGVFGFASFITPVETTEFINSIITIVGIVGAVYGRFVARPVETKYN